jgi:hypothetical protein
VIPGDPPAESYQHFYVLENCYSIRKLLADWATEDNAK